MGNEFLAQVKNSKSLFQIRCILIQNCLLLLYLFQYNNQYVHLWTVLKILYNDITIVNTMVNKVLKATLFMVNKTEDIFFSLNAISSEQLT